MKRTIHDEKGIEIPHWLKEMGFDFSRDISKIHALELPVEEISIKELEWHLDMPFFWLSDKPFTLRPRDVIDNPNLYQYRINRILGVDINYPIDIMYWQGRWQILDGLHRLCQQVIKGNSTVRVRKVPLDLKDLITPNGNNE